MSIHGLKLRWDGIEGRYYYLYWWNWLPRNQRHWGFWRFYYDGPHVALGWWFGNVSWRLPWTHFGPNDVSRSEAVSKEERHDDRS